MILRLEALWERAGKGMGAAGNLERGRKETVWYACLHRQQGAENEEGRGEG